MPRACQVCVPTLVLTVTAQNPFSFQSANRQTDRQTERQAIMHRTLCCGGGALCTMDSSSLGARRRLGQDANTICILSKRFTFQCARHCTSRRHRKTWRHLRKRKYIARHKLYRRQRRTEPWPQTKCTENLVKLRLVVAEICVQTDRQTETRSSQYSTNTVTPLCGAPNPRLVGYCPPGKISCWCINITLHNIMFTLT